MSDLINQIQEKDRILGKLCSEAEHSYEHENYFAALACLFVISEQIVKHSINKIDGNFHQAITEAMEKKIIDDAEYEMTDSLRQLRNKIFHENNYSMGIEIDGKNFPIDEDEIKVILYKKFSNKLFLLVLKLI